MGNRKGSTHLLSCFPWHEWHSQGWGYLLLCVCKCGYQEVCLSKVTGWDRHVTNSLGLCFLSVSHTHTLFFLVCYPPCTHSDTHTNTAELCHADLLSSFVTCSDLLCSPSLTTEATLFLGHHFTLASQDSTSIICVFPLPFLFPSSPLMSLSKCQDQMNQTRKELWLCACKPHHQFTDV